MIVTFRESPKWYVVCDDVPVGEDSTVEEGAKLTLNETRYGAILEARVSEPGFEVMLDHPIQDCRLGTARGVFGRPYRLAGFSHVAIVVSGSGRGQQVLGIEFPRHNGWRRETVPAVFHCFSTTGED